MAQQHPLPIVAGDAVDRLPGVLTQVPEEAMLCIYHSYTMEQTPEFVRERISYTSPHGSILRVMGVSCVFKSPIKLHIRALAYDLTKIASV